MYVSPATLTMHIQVLKQHFTLIHLDDWVLSRQQGKTLPGNCCALTFDDGWLDNYQYAWPVLQQASAPATIFLVSDLVGTAYEFWPNRLARLLTSCTPHRDSTRWPLSLRKMIEASPAGADGAPNVDAVIAMCKQKYADAEMLTLITEWEQAFDVVAGARQRDLMDWSEIAQMQAGNLVRFGSHSRRHTRLLDRLSVADAEDEIAGSLSQIEKKLGKRPTLFCYPNGDHSAVAVDLVRDRYLAAVTTRRGWNSSASDTVLMNRVGVHEDVSSSRTAFVSRLAGVG
jgi:peptidoglycan/xylan/chitin deacetylase (PgdA/CDA1 family)